MLAYLGQRVTVAVLALLIVSAMTFTLINASTSPALAIAGETATAADIALVTKTHGLDRPLPVRYAEWLKNAILGDLGTSYRQRRPVVDILKERLPVTVTLGVLALAFALALSLPLGVLAAAKVNTVYDQLALTVAMVGQAIPSFWFALLLILVLGVGLGWLPISGNDTPLHFVLPAIALGYYASPTLMRLTRAGMLDVLSQNYITTARAKGVSRMRIIFRHALPVAILPVVSVAAVQLGFMLGGSVVIESVFAMNGVGYLAWEAITTADIPVMQAIVVGMSAVYVLLTLFADLFNAWLDPRIRQW